MILDIVVYPDKILEQKMPEVTVFDENLKVEVQNMIESMYHHKGIGLAANQVGIAKRMFVMDIRDIDDANGYMCDQIYHFINPKITGKSSKINGYEEGCLSVPGQRANVERPEEIELEYQDFTGKFNKITAKYLAATCIQHEMDHLDGAVFIDRVKSKLKQNMMRNKAVRVKKDREN